MSKDQKNIVLTIHEEKDGLQEEIHAYVSISIPFLMNVCQDCIYLFDDTVPDPKYQDEKICSKGLNRQRINWNKVCYDRVSHKKLTEKTKLREMYDLSNHD